MSVSARAGKHYARKTLKLGGYLRHPGDGRKQSYIPASTLLWGQFVGYLLRETSFMAMEQLSKCGRGRMLGVSRSFGDDAVGYFTQRMNPEATRQALARMLNQSKRNKAFQESPFIGLAIDGTGGGRNVKAKCLLCRPYYNAQQQIVGYNLRVVAVAVVGCGLTLPLDAEPYGPGDCEYNAGQRLLRRAVEHLGRRFADYVVVDGEFATAPFLHAGNDMGLSVVARLKDILPERFGQARDRFEHTVPHTTFQEGPNFVEMWD